MAKRNKTKRPEPRQLVVSRKKWGQLSRLARWIEDVPPFVEVCDATWEGVEEWTNAQLPLQESEYCVSLETQGSDLIAVLATDPHGDEIRHKVVCRA
jgi:hypothetical protein